MVSDTKPILLVDGECSLCRYSVYFVIENDTKEIFVFTSQQSAFGQSLMQSHGIQSDISTVFLIDEAGVHSKSTAALRTLKRLGFPWFLFSVFLVLPLEMRDQIYDFIGLRRYRWFGRADACWMRDEDNKRILS